MNTITCLIVDDEPLALDLIQAYVLKTPFLDLKGRCSGPKEAIQIMNEQNIDLLFLDIQMLDMTGIEFAKMVPSRTKVIFTTAFQQYALEGFKVDALDYLLKPFNYDEFLKSANKAKEWFELVNAGTGSELKQKSYTFVKSEYKLVKINFDEVLYIEGLKDYIKIYMIAKTAPILSLISMKAMEEQLPSDRFMRVHRSYIVHLDKIESVERSRIKIGSVDIPLADNYKERFQQFIKKIS